MKLREKFRRFWTMDVHNHEGFTLVELIIVIAILAILSSVAVVGYSSYVEKANKQVDQTFATEIGNALALYYYANSNQLSGTTYVVVTDSGVFTENAFAIAAMQAAYGDNWATSGALKYGMWAPSFTQNASGSAADILNSTYVQNIGTEKLLGDVQDCVSGLSGFLTILSGGDTQAAANKLAGFLDNDANNNAFSAILDNSGSEMTEDTLANATLFAVADYAATDANKAKVKAYFTDSNVWSSFALDGSSDMLYNMANWFAASEALVGYLNDETSTNLLNQITVSAQGGNWQVANTSIKALQDRVGSSDLRVPRLKYYNQGMAETNANAYLAMMDTVNDNKGTYATGTNLSNPELVSSSGLVDSLNTYVAGAQVAGNITDATSETIKAVVNGTYTGSAIVVYLVINADGIVNTLVDMADKG